LIGTREAVTRLETLHEDLEEVRFYLDRELVMTSVGELASQALSRIRDH
jgi:hypothetical protein